MAAGDDHRSRAGQGRALAGGELGCLGGAEPGLQAQGMMDQGHEVEPGRSRFGHGGHGAEGEAVDHHRGTGGQAGQGTLRDEQIVRAREGKSERKAQEPDVPAAGLQLVHQAPVVEIAAGADGEIARKRQHQPLGWAQIGVLECGPGDVAFPQGHLDRADRFGAGPELAGLGGGAHALEHVPGQELGGGVLALEHLEVVEVLVAELAANRLQRRAGTADVDDDVARRDEPLGAELAVDDEGGPVQLLRRPEHLALETVRDHHMLANADAVHGFLPARQSALG